MLAVLVLTSVKTNETQCVLSNMSKVAIETGYTVKTAFMSDLGMCSSIINSL